MSWPRTMITSIITFTITELYLAYLLQLIDRLYVALLKLLVMNQSQGHVLARLPDLVFLRYCGY